MTAPSRAKIQAVAAKVTAADFNPIFREYASSAAFRLELSAGMIEYLLWLRAHPQTLETSETAGLAWIDHAAVHRGMTFPALTRRGLVFHRFVSDKRGKYTNGPKGTEGRGWYYVGLTRAGELAAELALEAGWGKP